MRQNTTLNGSVPGGGPPEKLHQVSLCHAERSFKCPLEDCQSSYRRKDHLNRHMLQHQGKLFECPVEDCKRRFTFKDNMNRHIKEFHSEHSYEKPKEYVCAEPGCGKVFKYPSKLRKHENSHVRLDSVESLCAEPGCMKYFSNEQCLKDHVRSCHRYIVCGECGIKQLKKNIKRHLRKHETGVSSDGIECGFKGCLLKFSNTSNRNQHIKAVHLGLKPHTCSILGCCQKFAYKHVRDNHETSGCHIYIPGNFEESDEQFRSRPRGGRKRKYPVIETLMRKRVSLNEGSEFLSRLLSVESEQ
ncbi:transcription factor IIIA-like isoform X2 [Henckelia pumila]|uniref:transcription factor IIIA-like isoform X2 n=1 Tax=Henckelia pumila TaxID=405737 RepID=UPI003C6DBA29